MDKAATVASRAGLLVAVALFAVSCTESVSPERSRPVPSFSYSPNGVTFNKSNATMGMSGQLLIKGFNPTNPHRGDAIVATFFWVGSTNTNIIDSVVDVLTTNPYTRVGNKYTLVEYITAGGYSMATYVATNVQNFPDPNTDPGQSDILAVAAYLSQPVTDGGLTLSAYTGVEDNLSVALGNHLSSTGTGSAPMFVHTAPIAVNAGALAYSVTMSGLWGLDPPQGFVRMGPGSDNAMKQDAAFAVQAGAGTVDPQWAWFFGSSGDTWLVTTLALNAAGSPVGSVTATTTTTGLNVDPDGYSVAVDGGAGQSIPVNGTVTFDGVSASSHSVALSGLAANCTVTGANPQTVSVPSGGTATAAFAVNCTATTGDLAVNTSSSGSSIPSGYTVAVDGGQSQTIASTGSFTFTSLSAASHTTVLAVPSNCTVSGGASQTVTVPAGGTVTVSYTVTCITPPGDLAVTTSSSGANIPASYTVTVDGSGRTIASTGNLTITNLSAGNHNAVLAVPSNCTVSGGASRTVAVPSGGTAKLAYSVSCNAPPVVEPLYTLSVTSVRPSSVVPSNVGVVRLLMLPPWKLVPK